MVITNLVYVSKLSNYRVQIILRNNPTIRTTAYVVEIQSRNSRGGAKLYAIFDYSVNGKNVEQAVYNGYNNYEVGDKLNLKCSIEYPEMFEITGYIRRH